MAQMTLVYTQPSGYFSGKTPAAKTVTRQSIGGAPTDSYSNYKVTSYTVSFDGQVYISYGVTATMTTNGASFAVSMGEAQSTKNFTAAGTSLSNTILDSSNTAALTINVSRNGGSGTGNCALFKSDITITVGYEYAYTPCSAPSNISVSNSTPNAGASIQLSWSGAAAGDINPITGYTIYRSSTSTGTFTELTTLKTSSTAASTSINAPASMGASYYYKVKTIGTVSGYDSDYSKVIGITAKTITAATAPTTVALSASTVDAGTAFTLSWSGADAGTNNAIAGYNIYKSTDNSTFEMMQNYATAATNGSISITQSPSNDTTYYYKIVTVGAVSGYDSEYSKPVSINVLTYTAVGDTTAKVAATIAEGTVAVSWDASAEGHNNAIAGYLIQYQDSADGTSWGGATSLKTASSDCLTESLAVNPTRGAYRRYLITPQGTKAGFNGNVATTAAVRTNRLPVAPQLLAPVKETTYSEQPFVRFFAANEADNQKQELQCSIDGSNFTAIATIDAAGGTYAVHLPTLTEGSHKVILRLFDGLAAGEETAQFTVNYTKFTQPKTPATLSAERMNAFVAAINTIRAYYGLDAVAFDTIAAGDLVKAAHHNALVKAQEEYNKLTGGEHVLNTVKAYDVIKRKDDFEIYNAIIGG